MPIITPDTFDPLRRFVSVRWGQGIPIVDAEVNESDDIRRFELRAYLKWFVGDGVPWGSDAFLIQAAAVPAANDFVIRAGVPAPPGGTDNLITGLRHVGRCLVDGLDAVIEEDVGFRAQEIHTAVPTAADTAAQRATVVIPELPVLDGSLLVFMDVWEWLLGPDDEPLLIFPDIGTETCARIRRDWAVRARDAADVPQPGDPDHQPGHSYYALARIARVAADPVVYPSQIEDLRERSLLTPPATLITDLLGTTPDRYRRGLDRPVISLREAVNALLRGELPGSADQAIAPDAANDFATRSILRTAGETIVLWHSDRAGGTNQVFATRWSTGTPAQAGTNPPVQITPGPGQNVLPAAVLLPTQPTPSFFVAYQAQNDIRFRRAADPAGLPAATEDPVAVQAEAETSPVAVRAGQIVTVFWHWNGPGTNDLIRYRRRQYNPAWDEGAAVWLDGETQSLSTLRPRASSTVPGLLHAAVDSTDRIWIAFGTFANNIAVARLTPASGAIETWTDLELTSLSADQQPFVLVDEPGQVWVFWRADDGIWHQPFDLAAAAWGAAALVPGTGGAIDTNERPCAVLDEDGGIWLLWTREDGVGGTDIWTVRRDPGVGGWGEPRQVTASAGSNDFPVAFADGGAISLFYRSNRTGQFDLYFKQLITAV